VLGSWLDLVILKVFSNLSDSMRHPWGSQLRPASRSIPPNGVLAPTPRCCRRADSEYPHAVQRRVLFQIAWDLEALYSLFINLFLVVYYIL